MKKLILLFIIITTQYAGFAQVVTISPAFPEATDLITVTFNAAAGNKGLLDYTGDVYAHTGVITSESVDDSDWKYVKTEWGVNSTDTKLTRIDENTYELKIADNSHEFYAVPEDEEILRIAFVFRSQEEIDGAWIEAKSEEGSDIFVNLSKGELSVSIVSPDAPKLLAPNQTFNFLSVANHADSIVLYVNNKRTAYTVSDSLTWSGDFAEQGNYMLKVIAKTTGEQVADSISVFVLNEVPVASLPANVDEGINYISNTEATLVLFAPNKKHVFAIGDFNNWQMSNEGLMNQTPDGNYYWTTIENLTPSKEYIFQYWVDNEIKIGDPYAEKISDPWNDKYILESTYSNLKPYPTGKTTGVATYLQTYADEYSWKTTDFIAPSKEKLVIYELLIRDFTEGHSYQSLINKMDYFKDLGINAIEFLPINEFEGNESWGYNPTYYFAPDKYYGSKNKLKEFIDLCHQNGIAVIIDMVLNHAFGQAPQAMLYFDKDAGEYGQPSANNPWLNPTPKHPFNVGFDFNHESEATQKLVERVVKYWLEEYKIDGYRFDLSKGFTQNYSGDVGAWNNYDVSRVDIWKRISGQIWETNPNAYVILEHLGGNDEEKDLANNGMMLWGKASEEYYQSAMGYHDDSDFKWKISYKERGWNSPHLIGFMESHDEERVMYQCLEYGNPENSSYKIKGDTTLSLKRMEQATAFMIPVPGPKMIWQFGELGYDYDINYNGRTGSKPIKWDYTGEMRRLELLKMHSAINKAKTTYDAFSSTDFSVDAETNLKKIHITDSDFNVLILGNFGLETNSITPYFQNTGRWYEFYTGDSIEVTNTTALIELKAGEYRMYTTKNIKEAKGTQAEILDFSLPEQNTPAIINHDNRTIAIEVKSGTDVTMLSPQLSLSSRATVFYPTSSVIDFSSAVKIGIISDDLKTENEYQVSLTVAPSAEAEMLSFSVENQKTTPVIFSQNRYIQVLLKSSVNISALKAEFILSDSAKTFVNTVEQISGSTLNDFSNTIYYTVLAEDGITEKIWMIQTTVAVSVNNNEDADFKVYPNPFTNEINLSGITGNAEIKVFSLTGKMVLHQLINGKQTISTSGLSKGIYVLQVKNGDALMQYKIVKQ